MPTLLINFEAIPSRAYWNFEEQNKVFESSLIINNNGIIIPLLLMCIKLYCIINA